MPYLADLGLTLAVEVPIVAFAGRAIGVRIQRAAVVAVAANLLTHPLLWFAAPWLHDRWGLAGVVLAEATVVVAEAAVYRRWLERSALAGWLALLANATSFGAGLVAHHGLP